jgi:F0F1-type ATP synthase assembly protein I
MNSNAYGLVMLAVTEFVVTVLIGLFGGRWLDGHYSSGAKFMTIGVIVGFILASTRMVIRLKGVMGSSSD